MTTADSQIRDIIIIGGGPAGLTAGLYASRARRNTLLIERTVIGGQIATAERVDNFPGFPEGISGFDLGELMNQQAAKYGLETVMAEVSGLKIQADRKLVETTEGEFAARAVIIAAGSDHRLLDVPGEREFTGRGVSYCATCDAAFFRDRPVAVAGGGDTAVTDALHLTKFATTVSLIHRRDQLRASKVLQEQALNDPKINVLWDSVVEQVQGTDFVERLRLRNVATGQDTTLEVAGLFVAVGFKPDTGYLADILPRDEVGHLITNEKMETGIPGVFAAGDIRHNSARQAISAAGDGATAAINAEIYLAALPQRGH